MRQGFLMPVCSLLLLICDRVFTGSWQDVENNSGVENFSQRENKRNVFFLRFVLHIESF